MIKRMPANAAEPIEEQSLRADAQRNYDALVDAAAVVFAVSGIDVPIKELAERAGVGVGTVYRRFPKRSDLIVAVFRREVDMCAEAASVVASDHAPFEALTRWLRRYQDLIVTKRGLAAALRSDESAYDGLPRYFEDRMVPPLQGLLRAAGNEIKVEVSAVELLRAVASLCAPAASGDVDQTNRMVALLLRGLRSLAEERQGHGGSR